MNKLLALLAFTALMVSSIAHAQEFGIEGNDYLQVTSYDGATSNNPLTVFIRGNGFFELKPGWRIGISATAIANSGKVLSPDNLFIVPHSLIGRNDTPPIPTIADIGMLPITNLRNNSEVLLVAGSPARLINMSPNGVNSYYYYNILLNYGVRGGTHLNSIKKGSPLYSIRLLLKLYDSLGKEVRSAERIVRVQVMENLSGTNPPTNNFTLQISSEAKKGLLEVKTISDYVNGASVTYDSGVSVSSNTPFQLTVRSQQVAFVSKTGKQLDLNTVKVSLMPKSVIKDISLYNANLSITPQLLLRGATTAGSHIQFDLKYSSVANDESLFHAESDNYSTILTYEMTVQ